MKLKSNLTYVYKVGNSFILPGLNYLDDLTVLDHPHIQAHIENNTLELLSDLPKSDNNKISYEQMNAKDLIKEIKDIFNINLLEEIKKNDSRKLVLEAVEKQMKVLRSEDGE